VYANNTFVAATTLVCTTVTVYSSSINRRVKNAAHTGHYSVGTFDALEKIVVFPFLERRCIDLESADTIDAFATIKTPFTPIA
jgi:hypothetical protein